MNFKDCLNKRPDAIVVIVADIIWAEIAAYECKVHC